MRYGIVEG